MSNINEPDVNERSIRNHKAMQYLDKLKDRYEKLEQEREDRNRARGLGCFIILLFAGVFWYLVYHISKALGEL